MKYKDRFAALTRHENTDRIAQLLFAAALTTSMGVLAGTFEYKHWNTKENAGRAYWQSEIARAKGDVARQVHARGYCCMNGAPGTVCEDSDARPEYNGDSADYSALQVDAD